MLRSLCVFSLTPHFFQFSCSPFKKLWKLVTSQECVERQGVALSHLNLHGSVFLFPMCMCVSLYHVIQNLFPQQLRLRGPARPRLPPHRPLLSFAEETGTEKWNTGASAGKFPPYGFLRIGIYVLGLVWMYFFYSKCRNDEGSCLKKLELFVEPCKVRGELLFAFFLFIFSFDLYSGLLRLFMVLVKN